MKWCLPLIDELQLRDIIPYNQIFSCNSGFNKDGLLKPDNLLYYRIEQNLLKNNPGQIYFIDDSVVNLVPVMNNLNWTPILYQPEDVIYKSAWMNSISSLDQLNEIVFNDVYIQ